MKLTLVRNACVVVEYGGRSFLIDPALNPAGVLPPVPNTASERRNPLVEVPESTWPLIDGAEVVIVSHLHQDHFDDAAKARIPHDKKVLCLPEQAEQIRGSGFEDVTGVDPMVIIDGIVITRTPGQHGTGEIAQAMAPVGGFVFRAKGEPTLYVAGDTVWYEGVAQVIAEQQPDVIVVNGGAGQFLQGDPITMTSNDIAATANASPDARLVVVHLEAISHCLETREFLDGALTELGVRQRVAIPLDGESVGFAM